MENSYVFIVNRQRMAPVYEGVDKLSVVCEAFVTNIDDDNITRFNIKVVNELGVMAWEDFEFKEVYSPEDSITWISGKEACFAMGIDSDSPGARESVGLKFPTTEIRW